MRDAADVYTKSSFSIDTKTESAGGERVGINGKADIGGVARNLVPFAIDRGAYPTRIGKDAIAAIVNLSNPVKGLSKENLKRIFTGNIKNWKEVGGADAPIKVYIVQEFSATRGIFKKKILGKEDYRDFKGITPDSRIISVVAADPYSIGQISLSFIKSAGNSVRPLSIGGQEASVHNINYPVTRPLHLVTKGKPEGEAKNFIDWVLSPEGQKVLKRNFVGIK